MEIKEKAKKFVKNNWRAMALGVGGTVIAVGGFVLGRKFTLGEFENYTKINYNREFIYSTRDCILKDFWGEDALTDALKGAGFTSLEDQAKIVAFVQKK